MFFILSNGIFRLFEKEEVLVVVSFSLSKICCFVFIVFCPQVWEQNYLLLFWFMNVFTHELSLFYSERQIGNRPFDLNVSLLFPVSIISPGPSSNISASIYFCVCVLLLQVRTLGVWFYAKYSHQM